MQSIGLGENISSSWTPASPFSINRPFSYSQPFVFEVTTAGNFTISLTSDADLVDTYLYLVDGCDVGGQLVVDDDDGGVGFNSQISMFLKAGVYTIDATTFGSAVTGDFKLTLN